MEKKLMEENGNQSGGVCVSTFPYCKVNINNIFEHWGDILGLLRDQTGCFGNSGRLKHGPKDDLFPRATSSQTPDAGLCISDRSRPHCGMG